MNKPRKILFGLLSIAAIFYLFLYPALVASNTVKVGVGATIFAAFLFIQLWTMIAELAFQAASAIYGFRRKTLFPFIDLRRDYSIREPTVDGLGVAALVFLSYFFAVYAYGVLYVYISHIDTASFSKTPLTFVDGQYFSLVTATTVGYGDITPRTGLAKLAVMSQICFSLVYLVALLSVLAAYIREGGTDE